MLLVIELVHQSLHNFPTDACNTPLDDLWYNTVYIKSFEGENFRGSSLKLNM